MAIGSNSAVPETPAKTGGTDDYDTEKLVETPGTDKYTGRSVSFEEDAHESGEAMEEDYDLEEPVQARSRSIAVFVCAFWAALPQTSDHFTG
ncbi:hypothetical protein PHMEG_00025070 [Phytophthora megakarya]|uniref:Eukaryotic/viral aspartic protease n=1 Tax=Phytophthora megakarya TaxID=4795 RepID=A0A225VE59_9STRA|nr:hypothetical protein PHMEG_00025070 [Phytophthora megakarya]